MSNRYGMYSCSFDDGAGGLVLGQVDSYGTRTAKSMTTIHASGEIDPAAHIMSTARPIIQFGTRDLSKVLSKVSLTAGLALSGGATMMYRRRVPGGGFDATSAHVTQAVSAGFLHMTELAADAESSDASKVSLEFVALSSDGNNPFTTLAGQAIPGALTAPAYNSAFFLGPCYFNSSILRGLVRSRVRPGIQFTSRIEDGGSFPRSDASSINRRVPMIELEFLKVDMIPSVITDIMVAAFTNPLALYFQLGSTGNQGRVAAASTVHSKITAAAGSWGPEDVSVADENDATLTLAIRPTGTLALSTASAIP